MNNTDYERAYVSIPKDKIGNLPLAQLRGEISVIDKEELVEDAIAVLREHDFIGFDTETKPSFKKGQINHVALVQLSTPSHSFLFRTNLIGLHPALIEILEDENITKVGLSIHDDFHNLNKIQPIEPKSFIDLQSFVKGFKIADNSLSRLYAILFDERISKGQRLTNWEAESLTPAQQVYAALDAQACLSIYNYLISGKFNPSESKYLVYPPIEEESSDSETEPETHTST